MVAGKRKLALSRRHGVDDNVTRLLFADDDANMHRVLDDVLALGVVPRLGHVVAHNDSVRGQLFDEAFAVI